MSLGLDFPEDNDFGLQRLFDEFCGSQDFSPKDDNILPFGEYDERSELWHADMFSGNSNPSQSKLQDGPGTIARSGMGMESQNDIDGFLSPAYYYPTPPAGNIGIAKKSRFCSSVNGPMINRKDIIVRHSDCYSYGLSSTASSVQQATPRSDATTYNRSSLRRKYEVLEKDEAFMNPHLLIQSPARSEDDQPKVKRAKRNPSQLESKVAHKRNSILISPRRTPDILSNVENNLKDESTNKTLARRIPTQFISSGFICLKPSKAGCLDVVLDYRKYTGVIEKIIINKSLANFSCASHNKQYCASYPIKPMTELAGFNSEEKELGVVIGPSPNTPISVISGVLQRKTFVRNIDYIRNLVRSISYVDEPRFGPENPYLPQTYRFEIDHHGMRKLTSKCGLCPYCPEVKFLPYKNSSYVSHMKLAHGIHPSGKLTPEALYLGKYEFCYTKEPEKNKIANAMQCPACFCVIELKFWSTKTNPLIGFFRHYNNNHSKAFDLTGREPSGSKHQWREGNKVVSEFATSKKKKKILASQKELSWPADTSKILMGKAISD